MVPLQCMQFIAVYYLAYGLRFKSVASVHVTCIYYGQECSETLVRKQI